MVIAKHSLIGNCLLFILNGKDVSDGVKSILGINPIFPICDPNTLWFIDNICKVVPLHSPELMSASASSSSSSHSLHSLNSY